MLLGRADQGASLAGQDLARTAPGMAAPAVSTPVAGQVAATVGRCGCGYVTVNVD
jgi:hypothetical protein